MDGVRRRPDRAREDAASGGRATLATALILLVLGIAVIAAPGSVPGLMVPGAGTGMDAMDGGAMPMQMH